MTISGAALGLKAALQRVSELVSSVSEASPLAGAALLLSARNPEELTSDLLDVCESLDLEARAHSRPCRCDGPFPLRSPSRLPLQGSPEPPVGLSLACAAAALQLQERKGQEPSKALLIVKALGLPCLHPSSQVRKSVSFERLPWPPVLSFLQGFQALDKTQLTSANRITSPLPPVHGGQRWLAPHAVIRTCVCQ